MSVEINADDFCITPGTTEVVASPWLVEVRKEENSGSISAVELRFFPLLIGVAISPSTEYPSSPPGPLGGPREDPPPRETRLLRRERQINYRSRHPPAGSTCGSPCTARGGDEDEDEDGRRGGDAGSRGAALHLGHPTTRWHPGQVGEAQCGGHHLPHHQTDPLPGAEIFPVSLVPG